MFDMDMLLKRSAKPSFPGPNPGGTSKSNSNLYKRVAVFVLSPDRQPPAELVDKKALDAKIGIRSANRTQRSKEGIHKWIRIV